MLSNEWMSLYFCLYFLHVCKAMIIPPAHRIFASVFSLVFLWLLPNLATVFTPKAKLQSGCIRTHFWQLTL